MDNPNEGLKTWVLAVLATAMVLLSALLDDYSTAMARPESMEPVMRLFNLVGNGGFLAAVAVGLYLLGLVLRRSEPRRAGSDGITAIVAGSVAVHLLKAAFERPRMSHTHDAITQFLHNPALFDLTGRFNSFPSGHATVSFAVAYVLARRFPRVGPLFYLTAVMVAAARVYLGSHYPSDVAGGAVLGLITGHLVFEKDRKKWLFGAFALLVVFVSFFKTGGFLLFDVDEAVFSEASREMLETGDFITPTYNNEPRYDKPILIYWFMSASFALFGLSEFAARFTSSAFGALLVMMTFFFVRRVKGEPAGYFSALALLLNLEFFVYSHSAVTDMTLTFFITASLYSFYLGAVREKPGWFYLAWGSAALAVLTKGVVGLLFPAMVAVVYLLLAREPGRLKVLLRPSHIALFLVISAPWFAAEFMARGWEFFDAFIVKHHIQRYTGVISSHSGPVYYYLLVILIGFFPWVGFLPGSLVKAFRGLRGRRGGLYLLAAVWFVLILVFFSASRTKLPNYIFPLYPAMAIMTGLRLSELFESPKAGKAGVYVTATISVLFSAGVLVLAFIPIESPVEIPGWFFPVLSAILFAPAAASVLMLRRSTPGVVSLSASALVLLVFLRLYAVPPANVFMQEPLYRYSAYARDKGVELATFELNKPSVAFYYRGKVLVAERSGAAEKLSTDRELLVITTPERVEELARYGDFRVLENSGDFVLATNSPALEGP